MLSHNKSPLRGYLNSLTTQPPKPPDAIPSTHVGFNVEAAPLQEKDDDATKVSSKAARNTKTHRITVAVRIRPFLAAELPNAPSEGRNLSYHPPSYLNFHSGSPLTVSQGMVKGTRQINICHSAANSATSSRTVTPTSSTPPSPLMTPRAAGATNHKPMPLPNATNNMSSTASQQCQRSFAFDHVLAEDSSDQDVYDSLIAPTLASVLAEGYNATIFAYGQTGSGKTHTMQSIYRLVGQNLFRAAEGHVLLHDELRFQTSLNGKCPIEISILELYNEELKDLAVSGRSLKLREDSDGSFVVQGLSRHLVYNLSEYTSMIEASTANRATSKTTMNDTSSRSHCLVTITVPFRNNAKIHLVDLAGSERLKKINPTANIGFALNPHRSAAAAQTLEKESIAINSGLFALGNVINALVLQQQQQQHPPETVSNSTNTPYHNPLLSSFNPARYGGISNPKSNPPIRVPYRDSLLTKLLKDGLGGNSRTVMIACVSPTCASLSETLNTLTYAQRAKLIRTRPVSAVDKEAQLMAASLLSCNISGSLIDQVGSALNERKARLRRSVLMDAALAGLIPPRNSLAEVGGGEQSSNNFSMDALTRNDQQERLLSTIVNDPRTLEMIASNPKLASVVLNVFANRLQEQRPNGSHPFVAENEPLSERSVQRASTSPRARQPSPITAGLHSAATTDSVPPSVSRCVGSPISAVPPDANADLLLAIERKHSHRLERDLMDREVEIGKLMKQISVLRETEEGEAHDNGEQHDANAKAVRTSNELRHRPTLSPSPGLLLPPPCDTISCTHSAKSPSPNKVHESRPTDAATKIHNEGASSPSPNRLCGHTGNHRSTAIANEIEVALLTSAKVLVDDHAEHLIKTVFTNSKGDEPENSGATTYSGFEIISLEIRLLQEELDSKRVDLAELTEEANKHTAMIDALKAEAMKWKRIIENSPSELTQSVDRIANAPFDEERRKELCEQVRRSCQMKLKTAQISLTGVENRIAAAETQWRRKSGVAAFQATLSSGSSSPKRSPNMPPPSAITVLSETIAVIEDKLIEKRRELRKVSAAAKRPHVSASPNPEGSPRSQGYTLHTSSSSSPLANNKDLKPPPAQSPQWRRAEREEIALLNKTHPNMTPVRCPSVQIPEHLQKQAETPIASTPPHQTSHQWTSPVAGSTSVLRSTGHQGEEDATGRRNANASMSKQQLFDTISSLGRASRDLAKQLMRSTEKQLEKPSIAQPAQQQGRRGELTTSPSPATARGILLSPDKSRYDSSPRARRTEFSLNATQQHSPQRSWDGERNTEGKRFQSIVDDGTEDKNEEEHNHLSNSNDNTDDPNALAAELLCQQISEAITLLHAADTELKAAEDRLHALVGHAPQSSHLPPYQTAISALATLEQEKEALQMAMVAAEDNLAAEVQRLGFGHFIGVSRASECDEARGSSYLSSQYVDAAQCDDDDDDNAVSSTLFPPKKHLLVAQRHAVAPSLHSLLNTYPHLWPLQRHLDSLRAEYEVISKHVAEAEVRCVMLEAESASKSTGSCSALRSGNHNATASNNSSPLAAIEALQDTVRNLLDEKESHVVKVRQLNETLMRLRMAMKK